MKIQSTLLALAMGVLAAGAAQAQTVVSVSVHAPAAASRPAVQDHRLLPPVVVHQPMQAVSVQHRPALMPVPHRAEQVRHAQIRAGDRLTRQELGMARDVDWRRAGLRAPQRGQHWVSLRGMYLLIGLGSDRVIRVA